MSKLAAGAGCDITDDELKNSINQHRIIMWRDWICIDSMPDSSRIAMAYPCYRRGYLQHGLQRFVFSSNQR